jgi:hypothetical protein
MPGCRIEREIEGDHAILRVAGILDRDSAFALSERLATEPSDDVVLDFTLVLEFADLGFATLARGLATAERRLRFRGLHQHQLRMFRYFGVDVEPTLLPAT